VDRETKARLYAECAVPEYWVVNLVDDLIEVHSDIIRGVYASVVPHRRGGSISPQAFEDLAVPVSDILR
jgi:Uma2 family endonuclease